MKIPKIPFSKGFGFLKFIRFVFVLIAVGSILFSAISIWQETHQLEPLIKVAGEKIVIPTYNLAEHIKSVSMTGLWENMGSFFGDLGNWFKNLYLFIEPLFLLYYPFFLLFKLASKVIVADDSRWLSSFLVAFIMYMSISTLYLAIFTDLPLLTPITSIGEIFSGLGNLF